MGETAESELTASLPPGLPGDWVFDRDLPCPKCRYNLRMLRTPRCPECGTIFRWQALLQVTCPRCDERLENVDSEVCPRCRLALNWHRLLSDADPEWLRLFEYARRPARALVHAWLAVLRPRRFWKSIPIESPPAVHRLRWLRRLAFGLCVPTVLASTWLSLPAGARITFEEQFPICAIVFSLPVITMLGLPRFTPTLTRFRVRRDQLLRCLAYATTGLAWIGMFFFAVTVVTTGLNALQPVVAGAGWTMFPSTRLYVDPLLPLECLLYPDLLRVGFLGSGCVNAVIDGALLYFGYIWWWTFLWAALRRYLQLDRRNAAALFASTQLIGLLVISIGLMRHSPVAQFVGRILNAVF